MRVCIIGAGVAGLVTARALLRRGAEVVVLEAADHVGGKCHSPPRFGRPYELGALGVFTTYHRTRAYLEELGLELDRLPTQRAARGEPARRTQHGPEDQTWQLGLADALGDADLFVDHQHVDPHALHLPVRAWLERHGLWPVPPRMMWGVQSCGYGYVTDAIPALYFLRLMSICRGDIWTVRGGYQQLCAGLAEGLDVRTGTPARRVTRGERIHVDDTLEADALVVTTTPRTALTFVDADERERTLLDAFRYVPYVSALVEAEGLPTDVGLTFVTDRQSADDRGHALLYLRPDADRPLYVVWQYGMDDDARDAARLEADFSDLGATSVRTLVRRRWDDYFPHLPPDALAAGFGAKLDALQGHRRTYWVGGAYTMELVEAAIRHAEAIANTHELG